MFDVAIIILNYNSISLTNNLIKSIKKYTKLKNYKIVIIDNASEDDISILNKYHSGLKLIKNRSNKGYASGNNTGIRTIKANYYCLINPDILLINDAITILKNKLSQQTRYGIAGPSLYDPSGNKIYEYYGMRNALYEISKTWKLDAIYLLNYKHQWNQPIFEANWVTGAFFMIKKEVIDSIGLLDEKYFLYSEEADYCLRAGKQGWKVICAPQAKVMHMISSIAKNLKGFQLYHQYRSKLIFIKKHFSTLSYMLLKIIYFFDIIFKMPIRLILENIKVLSDKYYSIYLKLLKEFIKGEI